MRDWAAPAGARALTTEHPTNASGRSALALSILTFILPGVTACGVDTLVPRKAPISIAIGQPSVDPSGGTVERRQAVNPGDFGETNPIQVDAFVQNATAKVDVLWVIDNSGSMTPKQMKVKANFGTFITQLTTPGPNQAVVDYHIGVVTTDTYNPLQSGKLQNPGGLSSPWIGNMDTCRTGCDPVAEFQKMASVGTTGSGDEKGLLAASMALTAPLINTPTALGGNAGFMRPDASIAVIVVSDEEDSSCSPIRDTTEGCDDSLIGASPGGYGNIAYYTRLFFGLKGFGNQHLVSMNVFVADTQDSTIPSSGGGLTMGLLGCFTPGGNMSLPFSYAVYAPRYIGVANGVSGAGAVHSICSEDFSAAVTSISTYATLTATFYLSRQPASAADVEVRVNDVLKVAGIDYNYNSAANSVTFVNVPPAGDKIEISYKVHANGM